MKQEPTTLTLQFTFTVSVTLGDVNKIEQQVVQVAKEGFVEVVKQAQLAYAEQCGSRWERHDWRQRTVDTRLGTVRVPLLRIRNKSTGEKLNVFSAVTGMRPGERATAWVKEQGAKFRVLGFSYRNGAKVMREVVGCNVSAMRIWRWVQGRGEELQRWEAARCERVWCRGCKRPKNPPERLYLEVDEIYLKAQRAAERALRVKVGLGYTGRRKVKEGRYELVGKSVYGGVFGSVVEFGRMWYSELESRYGVSEVEAVLYLSDQDMGLMKLREEHFPQAEAQVDMWHVCVDVRTAAPDANTARRWVEALMRGRHQELLRRLRRFRR